MCQLFFVYFFIQFKSSPNQLVSSSFFLPVLCVICEFLYRHRPFDILLSNVDMESLSCATILMHAVHTKAKQALATLYKCRLGRTEKRSFIRTSPVDGPLATRCTVQRVSQLVTNSRTVPVVLCLQCLQINMSSFGSVQFSPLADWVLGGT